MFADTSTFTHQPKPGSPSLVAHLSKHSADRLSLPISGEPSMTHNTHAHKKTKTKKNQRRHSFHPIRNVISTEAFRATFTSG